MGNSKKTDRGPALKLDEISSVEQFVASLDAEASALTGELAGEVSATQLEPLLRRWAEVDNAYDQMVLAACSAQPDLAPVATLERLRRDLTKIVIRFALNNTAENHQEALLLLLKELLPATLKLPSLSSWLDSGQAKDFSAEELRTRLQRIASDSRDRTKQQIQDTPLALLRPEVNSSHNLLEESDMPRDSNERERDEYGRFVSDDDRGRRSYSSRDDQRRSNSRDDDDDRRRSTSRDDDDDRRRSRDDDDRRGWYGDSEGHAEAARRGWEDRGSSRSMRSDYRDDDRRYGRRDDDDDRRYGRSSRDDDRGQGGWFGDPEGHSEASRRGWENREGSARRSSSRYEDDDRRSSSRGRDDEGRFTSGGGRSFRDDDDRSNYRARDEEGRFTSSSRGRGRNDDEDRRRSRSDYDDDNRGRRDNPGWSGDPEGHAEAARKGWEHRR